MPLAPASDSRRHPPLDGWRILVVDDNAHTATLVKQTLLAAGAGEVMIAGDGEEALAMLPAMRPDVLVTDMIMPILGGLELARAVRQAAVTPNAGVPDPTIPIVLVSAFGSRQSVRIARQAGIDAFVVKPFSIGSLVKRVDKAGRRTAEFVIEGGYIGPDRRGKGPRKGAHERRREEEIAVVPIPEKEATLASLPDLRLVTDDDAVDAAGPSLLQELYDRIRELEEEQARAKGEFAPLDEEA